MKNNMLKQVVTFWSFAFLLSFSSCQDDNKFTESIFVDEPAEAAAFDKWLHSNYLESYNLDFRYRMQDVSSDLEYSLVPASYDKSKQIAILIKYLWFDAYGEVVGPDFLKEYGPRVIHLIGSGAYNPRNGTIKLGTAEGGIKVTLFSCNDMDPNNVEMLNEYCFKTMHHEFAHILHQQKTYPKIYETYSAGHYDPSYWQERSIEQAASLGFVSAYGSSQPREDFVEVIANYIVKTQADWDAILDMASHEWKQVFKDDGTPKTKPNEYGGLDYVFKISDKPEDFDGIKGEEVILEKLNICREWLKTTWSVDLDTLRKNVQIRQLHILEALEKGYDEISRLDNSK